MRLWRKAKPEPNAGFDWLEVVCSSEDAAKAEAETRQSTEDPRENSRMNSIAAGDC